MTRTSSKKPNKPKDKFPLFAHASGQWAKKIRGQIHYFGIWDNPQGALDRYLDEKDYLLAGRTPPTQATTIADVLNQFLSDKKISLESGDLIQSTYDDYEEVCDQVAAIGKRRAVESLAYEDFSHLRSVLSKGTKGQQLAASSVKRSVTMARGVFKFANDELGYSLRYKKALRLPSAKALRKARNIVRLFSAKEIRQIRDNAKPQMRAMVLMAINCGFGNDDCGQLPIEAIENGWHNFPRPKTEVPRRCPLWPETVAALREVIGSRKSGLVFITKYGNSWAEEGRREPISSEFRKLVTDLGFYKKGITTFYSLRRTFETVAEAGVSQAVIDAIMGHVPHANNMGAIYRQKVFNDRLRECTNHVHGWLDGSITLD